MNFLRNINFDFISVLPFSSNFYSLLILFAQTTNTPLENFLNLSCFHFGLKIQIKCKVKVKLRLKLIFRKFFSYLLLLYHFISVVMRNIQRVVSVLRCFLKFTCSYYSAEHNLLYFSTPIKSYKLRKRLVSPFRDYLGHCFFFVVVVSFRRWRIAVSQSVA